MERRHVTHSEWTLAAVDDAIARGRLEEWKQLRDAAAGHLQVQLAHPLPYDLDETNLAEYRQLDPKWQDWRRVSQRCAAIAADVFRRL